MQKHINYLHIMILFMMLLESCGSVTPPAEVNSVMTSAVSTMVASYFDTQTALVTSIIITSTSAPTFTSFPTLTPINVSSVFVSPMFIYFSPTLGSLTPGTPTPTGTLPTATINSGALAVGCNNLSFIRDVTIPAGTVLSMNENFTKTWKVQNTGTCDWLYQYILVPVSGDTFGSDGVKIQKLVKVNNWTELSVGMTAPNKAGTYTSYWRLSNGRGTFGATLVLSFEVSDPSQSTPVPSYTNTDTPHSIDTPTETSTPTPTPP